MSERYWTAAEDAIVARELPQCCSEGAIRKRANMLGLSVAHPDRKQYPMRWVNGQRAELARLAGSGMTAKAIAAELGVTKNSVIGALSRNDDIYWPGRRNRVVVTTLYNRLPEIDTDSCRWLDGEPREFRYCGKPIARQPNSRHGESYCAEHRAIVWGGAPQRRQPDFPGRAKW